MTLTGHIQNGVVVFDSATTLPEGTRVSVSVTADSGQEPRQLRERADFPLVRMGKAGTWNLTNEEIAEILDEEDFALVKGVRDVPA
jgi:hypothetical protein